MTIEERKARDIIISRKLKNITTIDNSVKSKLKISNDIINWLNTPEGREEISKTIKEVR